MMLSIKLKIRHWELFANLCNLSLPSLEWRRRITVPWLVPCHTQKSLAFLSHPGKEIKVQLARLDPVMLKLAEKCKKASTTQKPNTGSTMGLQ